MGILSETIKKIDAEESKTRKEKIKDKFLDELDNKIVELRGDKGDAPTNEELIALINPLIPEPIKGDKGDKPVAGVDYPIPNDGKDGKDGENGRDSLIPGPKGDKGDSGKDGKDGSPDTSEQIKTKLEKLPIKEKWFDYRHIKNIPIDLSKKKRLGRGTGSPAQYYDLSGSCDGVTKTFTIPANARVLGVFGSQFPISYRPITDWTSTRTTLILTAEVSAPTTGQTLWILYIEE